MNAAIHKPLSLVSGSICLPGSKSISNRVLLIKALSGLAFEIENLSGSDDTRHLQKALDTVSQTNSTAIDIGHAGTDMRFLTSFLASHTGSYELTGSERMQQRPIGELVDVLKDLGADIAYQKENGYPPLFIKGKTLEGGKASIKGSISSQFISSLLLVAPYFAKGLELTITGDVVSAPYIHMTIELMKVFGADISRTENTVRVKPVHYTYHKKSFTVESDWSAASYYYSIIALSEKGGSLTLSNLFGNSLQADAVCEAIYKRFGVQTLYSGNEITITKTEAPGSIGFDYDFTNCPDIAQTLVCTCISLNRPFRFTGLKTLKVKETDRIIALQKESLKFGIELLATEKAMEYRAATKIPAAETIEIETYNDHRMAMSFAPLCLVSEELLIKDAEVVSKSYPGFWNDLETAGFIIKYDSLSEG